MFFDQRSSVNIRALPRHALSGVLLLALFVPMAAFGQDAAPITESTFVDVRRVDPTILIDLRYAGPNNSTHRPLYPPGMPAMVRFSVAQRLAFAQKYLKVHGYGLKIWDAYRPKAAQKTLWEATKNNDYVADPREAIGSMHTRGAAVDVTLVNLAGREVAMPTEFDNFTPTAMLYYQGPNLVVRSNLKLLQKAMARAGFYGLRTEWWHFCAGDWTTYPPVPEIQLLAQAPHPSL
jgi:D-alanyl-D-alanine dipeptidase